MENKQDIVSADQLRIAMRQWATGVTVVTAQEGDLYHGMTVSSFTSLSLEPPLVMVSLERVTRTHDLVESTGVFGVTVLAEDQRGVSIRFSEASTESEYRFEGLPLERMVTGVPFITGGLAYFDCKVTVRHDAGTHTVFIGEVLAAREVPGKFPLLYFDRDYRDLEGHP